MSYLQSTNFQAPEAFTGKLDLIYIEMGNPKAPDYWDYDKDFNYQMQVKTCVNHDNAPGTKVNWSGGNRNERNYDWNAQFLAKLDGAGLTLLPEVFIDHQFQAGCPILAPRPLAGCKIMFTYPSFIIWKRDVSYISFFGSD